MVVLGLSFHCFDITFKLLNFFNVHITSLFSRLRGGVRVERSLDALVVLVAGRSGISAPASSRVRLEPVRISVGADVADEVALEAVDVAGRFLHNLNLRINSEIIRIQSRRKRQFTAWPGLLVKCLVTLLIIYR